MEYRKKEGERDVTVLIVATAFDGTWRTHFTVKPYESEISAHNKTMAQNGSKQV